MDYKTQDTNRCIIHIYEDYKKPFTVYMSDNKGNKYKEDAYEGYMSFGGKDFFELLAEMNGFPSAIFSDNENSIYDPDVKENTARSKGIDLFYKGGKDVLYPNLTEDPNWKWVNKKPFPCGYTGDQLNNPIVHLNEIRKMIRRIIAENFQQ